MNCLLQKTSDLRLEDTTKFESCPSDEDSIEGSDYFRNFLVKRRKTEIVVSEDDGHSTTDSDESDEESDFCRSCTNQRQSRLLEDGSSWNLSLPSWASEMSLIDKLSPRGATAMASVKLPRTPPVIPTPTEFQGINWKSMTFDNPSNRSLLSWTGSRGSAGSNRSHAYSRSLGSRRSLAWAGENSLSGEVIAEGREEDQNDISSDSSIEAGAKTQKKKPFVVSPLEIDENEISISQISSTMSNTSSGEPDVDHMNLIVNYLPPEMNSTMLSKLFSKFGTIISCKVVVDHPSGFSKGYGFVKFQKESEGRAAQRAMHKFRIGKKILKVSFSRRAQHGEKTKHQTKLYISNLDPKVKPEDLERHFKTCGHVVQCKVLMNSEGVSKQVAFVRFGNRDSARRAINLFDGKQLEGTDRPMSIRIARTPRAPRKMPLFGGFVSPRSLPRVSAMSTACYVTGFHVSFSEEVLRRVFAPWGEDRIKSVRIIRRQNGPYAFINFYNCEDAAEAARRFNNTMLGNLMLIVRLQM